MGNLQSDVRQTVRWRWIEYDDSDGEAHTYGWWERSWQSQSNTPWYGQGVMRSLGDGLTGFANDVTFDLPDRIDRWMGREPTADVNSTAYQTGGWIGFAAGLLLPGPGKLKAVSRIKVLFGHGGRHLVGTGLSKRAVETAIRKEVQGAGRLASETGSFWGRITVRGQTVEYRAFTLPNGSINIGTYYIP
jgi:hypothetical protein